MKKIILTLSLFSFLVCDGISGVTYFKHADGTFSLSRVYFTYDKTISDNLSFKFQTDVGQAANRVVALASGDLSYSNVYEVYLKKAQLDWLIDESTSISMGMIGMNLFNIQEKTWGNRFILKSALDQFGWGPSADLGVGFTKEFNNSVSASLLITNGEGYKANMDEIDNHSRYSLQIVAGEKKLDKNDGNNFGLVFSNVKNDKIRGLFSGFSKDGLRVGLEYFIRDKDIIDVAPAELNLNSLYANYIVNEKMTAFIRLDEVESEVNDILSMNTTVRNTGFIFNPTKGLSISPNYYEEKVKYYDTQGNLIDSSEIDEFTLNFKVIMR